MTQELTGAFARGRDEYPTLLNGVIDMLDTHRFDPGFNKERHQKSSNDSRKDQSGKSQLCATAVVPRVTQEP
jgi:hypothetical protein